MPEAESLSRLAEYEAICEGDWCQGPDDGYFYQNLARLLQQAGRDKELYQLLVGSPDWMRTQSIACHGDGSYLRDLQLAIDSITDFSDTGQLLTLTQLYTAQRLVQKRVRDYNDDLLALMTRLGHQEEALNFAQLRTRNDDQFRGLLAIYEVLNRLDQPTELVLGEIQGQIMRASSNQRLVLLHGLTELLVRVGHVANITALIEPYDFASLEKDEFLIDVADVLLHNGYYKEASLLLESEIQHPLKPEFWVVKTLADLGVALSRTGQDHEADSVFSKAIEVMKSLYDVPQEFDKPGLASDNPAMPLQTNALKYIAEALWFIGRKTDAVLVLENIPDEPKRLRMAEDLRRNEQKTREHFVNQIQGQMKSADMTSVPATEQTLLAARTLADQLDEGNARIEAMKRIRRHFNIPAPEADLTIAPDEPERDLPSWLQPKTQETPPISTIVESLRKGGDFTLSGLVEGFAKHSETFEALEPGLSRSILCQTCRIAGWLSPNWKALYDELPCKPTEA